MEESSSQASQASAPRASIAATRSIMERELGFHRERLSIQLGVRIDKVVERVTLLQRVETTVSYHTKLHAVVVMRPEEIVLLLRTLRSLRGVHRDPAV